MATTISGSNPGGSVIWQGFDYGWRSNPHRVSRFGSHLDSFALQPNTRQVHARYLTSLGVGTINDTADARTTVASLVAPPLQFIHGFQTKTLVEEVGTPKSVADETVSIQLPPIAGGAVATPLLRGFDVQCTNFSAGYHTRGFGIELDNIQQVGSVLNFRPRFFIHPERSPDPFSRPPAPNTGPNEYEYQLVAYFTVVVAPLGQARFTPAPESTPTAIISYDGPTESRAEETCQILGQGGQAFHQAVVGVRAFSWQLGDHQGTVFDGRYLRQLQCFMGNQSYDPATGTASFVSHLWFTNQGTIPYDFNAEHRLWATLIQTNAAQAPRFQTLNNVVSTADGTDSVDDFSL
jgi:hypothetical protein